MLKLLWNKKLNLFGIIFNMFVLLNSKYISLGIILFFFHDLQIFGIRIAGSHARGLYLYFV